MKINCHRNGAVVDSFEISNIREFNTKLIELQLKYANDELALHATEGTASKILTVNNGCVIEIKKEPLEHYGEQQLQLWGLLNLLTQNIAINVDINWRHFQNTKKSAASRFLSESFQWVFALAAAMKAFTAGLGILFAVNEYAGIFYGIVVSGVASYFYKSNIANAQKEMCAYECESKVLTLEISNNHVQSMLTPNLTELKHNHNDSLSFFRTFSAMTYALGQFGMVLETWDSLAKQGSIIPFANDYFRNTMATLLIMANFCVGYLKSKLVHQLIYDTSDKLTQQFTHADRVEFTLLKSNLSRLNKLINEHKNIDGDMQGIIYTRLLEPTKALQGKPAINAILSTLQYYITYLEIYNRCLLILNQERTRLAKRVNVDELCKNLKDEIKAGLSHSDRETKLAEASTWLTHCLKITKNDKTKKQTAAAIYEDEQQPLLNGEDAHASHSNGGAHTEPQTTQEVAKQLFFGISVAEMTEDPELCHYEWSPKYNGLAFFSLYATIENTYTKYWNFAKLALSIIPVWPNIRGFSSLIYSFFSNFVIRYTAGIIASISPIGLNYESYNNLFYSYMPWMPKFHLQHGKQPSTLGKWVGRLLSTIASAVIYYSLVAYGVTEVPTGNDFYNPLLYFQAFGILVSWLTLIETKALPFFQLLTTTFESFKKDNKHRKLEKLNYTSEFYKEHLQLHLQAIGELMGRLEFRLSELNNEQMDLFNSYLKKLGHTPSISAEQSQFGFIEDQGQIKLDLSLMKKNIQSKLNDYFTINDKKDYLVDIKSHLQELLALCKIAAQSKIDRLEIKTLFFADKSKMKQEQQRKPSHPCSYQS